MSTKKQPSLGTVVTVNSLLFMLPEYKQGRNLITTVVHSDIRGLVTGMTWFRRGAASV